MNWNIVLATTLLVAAPVAALEPTGTLVKVAQENKAPQSAASRPTYVPPTLNRLQENTRVESGATRNARAVTEVRVLAPEHTGFTSQAQPVLYWYTSRKVTTPVEIVLEAADGPLGPPLVDVRLDPPFEAGLHSLDLASLGISLEVGREYAWRVIVVVDESRRSNDVYAGANIARIDEPATLTSALASASPRERPRIYASAGLWFDALASIEALSGDRQGRAQAQAECRSLLDGQALGDVSCPKAN